jgi:hypothetical protein
MYLRETRAVLASLLRAQDMRAPFTVEALIGSTPFDLPSRDQNRLSCVRSQPFQRRPRWLVGVVPELSLVALGNHQHSPFREVRRSDCVQLACTGL